MSDDVIDRTVDQLIRLHQGALERGNANWGAVRSGLAIVLDDLRLTSPSHPAIGRLREFIALNDALVAIRSLKAH